MTTEAALLGCGHPHANSHYETLDSLSEVGRIHLWDEDVVIARQMAERDAGKPVVVHESLDDLLSEASLGWVLAAFRHDVSADLLLRCAAAGKPVYTEKPIGLDGADVARVVAAFREAGLSLSVALVNRYKPAVRQMKRWVANGMIGRPTAAETRLHTTSVRLRNPRHWLFDKARSGGGILPWLGCHHLDLLAYVLDDEPVTVTGEVATLSGEAIDVEDLAVMTIGFAGGLLAAATFGYLMPTGSAGNSFASKDTWFQIKGTDGKVAFEPTSEEQTVTVESHHPAWSGAPARRYSFPEQPAKAYGRRPGLEFARDALLAALEGRDGPATGEDMLRIWRLIEAAYRSSADGVRVDLREGS